MQIRNERAQTKVQAVATSHYLHATAALSAALQAPHLRSNNNIISIDEDTYASKLFVFLLLFSPYLTMADKLARRDYATQKGILIELNSSKRHGT